MTAATVRAPWRVAASVLRRNVRESILLGLLLAVVVATVLAAVAGARRTDAAADQVGIPSHPVVTASSIALLVAAVAAVLLLVVILPARRAGRIRPADLLRQE